VLNKYQKLIISQSMFGVRGQGSQYSD